MKIKDFKLGNGGKLSLNSSIEDHHIYPKNYLFKILGNEPEFDFY